MAEQSNIRQDFNAGTYGMNQDNTPSQVKKGSLTYALNAAIESYSGSSVTYQNEMGNELCLRFPEGYVLIGHHSIVEQNKHILFITNPKTGDSQIGYILNEDSDYKVIVNAPCLNFSIHHPILKVVHKITNCSTEIYWTDGYNPRRYMNIDDVPKILKSGTPLCNPQYTDDVDCNQLKVQPNFSIPTLKVIDILSGGDLIAGTYQFAIQYADALGNPYTSYYSVTNPVPIGDPSITTPNFNYPVGKSIAIEINHLDISGQFPYYNIAVIKTINAVTSVELMGTYSIEGTEDRIVYTGQGKADIKLSIEDIFEKFPYYDIAQDLTTAQDILIWDQLSSINRVNYQQIANKIHLQWESWRIPATENYASENNASRYRSYLRDEIYPFEICFLLSGGKQTDSFHIPGRGLIGNDIRADVPDTNADFIGEPDYYINQVGYKPYWKVYNTASVEGTYPEFSNHPDYKGRYQWGEMAYWESSETYPCNTEVWGELAGKPIRHHKFPDVLISPIFESRTYTNPQNMEMGDEAIYPLGIRVDIQQVKRLIEQSNLTQAEKDDIVGFKILRGDRSSNKSIVAKGMLRNVNEYTRDDTKYYFPNYPYNDLHEDPFINSLNNAFADECSPFTIEITGLIPNPNGGLNLARIQYTDCNTSKLVTRDYTSVGPKENICSIGKPTVVYGTAVISYANYDEYKIESTGVCTGFRVQYNDITEGIKESWINGWWGGDREITVKVVVGTAPVCVYSCEKSSACQDSIHIDKINTVITDESCVIITDTPPLAGPSEENAYRQVFNSPETSFGQPFLGNILKIEHVMFGKGKAHFTEVKDNAKYKLLSKEAQEDALNDSVRLATLGGGAFDVGVLFAAYQAYLTIYIDGVTRKNFAYSFNSIASYDYWKPVENSSCKQRELELAKYLVPSVISVGDDKDINNWYRESSVYLKTKRNTLPFPHKVPSIQNEVSPIEDNSRFTISQKGICGAPTSDQDINVVAYYASLKNNIINQWGQIYSYDVIDTGAQVNFDSNDIYISVFGGDTFINRFAYKVKLPFFIDNRVGAPDDSDIFYDEIGNVGYPKYWHSSRSIFTDFAASPSDDGPGILKNIISYKAHRFDCPNSQSDPEGAGRTHYDGYFYLFAYGIPYFYCESSYNLDFRQAFNNREGDFFPHVSSGIPDDWLQESRVSIAYDNTYYYNTTFSKQNKENYFSHLPADWSIKDCLKHYPFRAIYSDAQITDADNRVNAWRTYRAVSYFDFPQNFGKLISLDGIQNSAVLVRFENKTLLYNNLLTIDTSNPQAAYIGNSNLFKGAPPIDFAETDLGYVGTQNKMLLKIPQGQIMVDAKRGQVFLIAGSQAVDISGFGSGLSRFFTEHLSFEILNYFPDVNVDNHFNGVGLHGVYDSNYDRVIITKKDYIPKSDDIKFDGENFYIEEVYESIVYRCQLNGSAIQIDTCLMAGTAIAL